MSWQKPKIDLVLGVIHTGTVSMEWALSFSQLYTQLGRRRFYLSYSRGAPYDISRNHCADDTLRLGAEWLFMLDSDVLVPPNVVDVLISKNLPVVSALYYRRHKPIHPAMWKLVPEGTIECPTCKQLYAPRVKGKYNPLVDYPRGALVEVDVVGCGALLVHRKVLEAVHHPPKKPAFIWSAGREALLTKEIMDTIIGGKGTSEDFYFSEQVKRAGYKIYVATEIICPHETTVKIVPPEKMNPDDVKHGGIEFPKI